MVLFGASCFVKRLVLRAKGVPYDEQLILLQTKPGWYKALVPNMLVTAVLFHEEYERGTNEHY